MKTNTDTTERTQARPAVPNKITKNTADTNILFNATNVIVYGINFVLFITLLVVLG